MTYSTAVLLTRRQTPYSAGWVCRPPEASGGWEGSAGPTLPVPPQPGPTRKSLVTGVRVRGLGYKWYHKWNHLYQAWKPPSGPGPRRTWLSATLTRYNGTGSAQKNNGVI